MDRTENETESFAQKFAASENWRLFFEVADLLILLIRLPWLHVHS